MSRFQPEGLDIKNKAVICDGRRAQATEEFDGTRFTITFYSVRLWERACEETRIECGMVPWVLPTVRQIESIQNFLPEPEGYKRGPAHVAQTVTCMKTFANGKLR